VRDNPVHYLFTKLGIDVASAYSVALTSALDIMDYGADDTQELFHGFHKNDLENEQLVISLLKIKTAGHVLNHLLEQGHNSIPNSMINGHCSQGPLQKKRIKGFPYALSDNPGYG
jgi:hypothetical protein